MEDGQQIETTYQKSPRHTVVSRGIGTLCGLYSGVYAASLALTYTPIEDSPFMRLGAVAFGLVGVGGLAGIFTSSVAANLMGTTTTVVTQKTVDAPKPQAAAITVSEP
jgi:hypothetical protein